ncbi:MAG: hypothetical protein OZSIB_0669 [Candidatus Ozemobacter sibiricus]|uniref:RanBP2-type domain-containing protein n=1 Tax=Candidatus Ozemobacter sibiricus TaxID=2268124 RepID=A0A367ZTR0_9BACT|nr:MAG: hypothetical protein OZSIB_0669 [Candidatus Ozemobacter sibiricus]
MIPDWLSVLILTAAPFAFLGVGFRRSWADPVLAQVAVVSTLAGGAVALVVKFLLYPGLQTAMGVDLRTALADTDSWLVKGTISIFLVGALEEGGKLAGALGSLAQSQALHRPPAAFLACLGAGLGFATLENLDYFVQFGPATLLLRSLVSTTGHLVFSGLIGVAMGAALQASARRPMTGYLLLLGGYLGGAILHGAFNLVALETAGETAVPILLSVLAVGLVVLHEGWHRLLRSDRARGDLPWICEGCGAHNEAPGRFCPACGRRQGVG